MPSGLSGGNGQLWVPGARPELLLGEYLIYEVPGAKAKVYNPTFAACFM